ncbi:MAG: hypothetical protein ACLQGP_42050 [Isosphaeraceae bacterium]
MSTPDDDTVDLPMPAFRPPAEWQSIYDRLPRLLAALHNIDVAMDRVYATEPADDATYDENVAFEAEADDLAEQERAARDALIAWFASFSDKATAVVLPDGRIIAITLEADGLAIVNPENVHKLA